MHITSTRKKTLWFTHYQQHWPASPNMAGDYRDPGLFKSGREQSSNRDLPVYC